MTRNQVLAGIGAALAIGGVAGTQLGPALAPVVAPAGPATASAAPAPTLDVPTTPPPPRAQQELDEELQLERARARQRELLAQQEALDAEALDARCVGKGPKCTKRVPSLDAITDDLTQWQDWKNKRSSP